ncbi:MAG: DUF169 domain-containing protein [Deltaproteobacteria bacterium]|nr:DUF169 domain-containing protein [Deltaproteobacteria bacterium]MBW2180974.1 DUF169 domain-containing protein [Deltaproteobacteria bacterium]
MQPDFSTLLDKIEITHPIIGFYDAPDPLTFEPILKPKEGKWACVFMFYKKWLDGHTLMIEKGNFGCGGAGYWICNVETRTREDFVKFLVDDEGLKSNHDVMNHWLDFQKPYKPEHPYLFFGPLKDDQYTYLKSVTFYVNPDQLSLLILGANYDSGPDDPPAVIAPFGPGCGQMVQFDDLNIPQAIIGSTDIAMRQYLPPEIMAFTVTKPLFEKLCRLDEKSFLYKPFWQNLKKRRGLLDT